MILKVVGVSFMPDYPDNLHWLRDQIKEGLYRGPMEAVLVREPENAHDPHAIRVQVGPHFLGYIPRQMAARIAPQLDAGLLRPARVQEVLIHPDHPERPGVTIQIGGALVGPTLAP